MYIGYWIAFDGVGLSNFGKDNARNAIIFGVENSSSSHPDSHKISLSVLSEGSTYAINGNFGAP